MKNVVQSCDFLSLVLRQTGREIFCFQRVFSVFKTFLRALCFVVPLKTKQGFKSLILYFFQIKFKSKVDKLKNWIKVEMNFSKNLHPLPGVRGRIFQKNLETTFQLIRKSLVFGSKKNIIIPSRLSEKNCKTFHSFALCYFGQAK